MEERESFLGTGWSFPPQFDIDNRSVRMSSEEQDIKESIRILLSTTPGERVMLPKFGSALFNSIFDSVDSLTVNKIQDYITHAILHFEPRITLEFVEVDTTDVYEGIVRIKIEYTIRKINIRTNMVFPFYIKEGNHLDPDLL